MLRKKADLIRAAKEFKGMICRDGYDLSEINNRVKKSETEK